MKEFESQIAAVGVGPDADSNACETAALSWGQKQMVRAMGIDRQAGHFHMTDELVLHGPVDVQRLARCLIETFGSHATLHVRFVTNAAAEEGLVQAFGGFAEVTCPVHDWSELAPDEAESRLASLRTWFRDEPFDLATPPLFRLAIVRLSALKSVLLLTVHHLLADDWSMGLLQQDLAARYLGRSRPVAPEAETPRYFCFARDQHAWLTSDEGRAASEYWSRQLADLPAQLPLPFDRARSAAASQRRSSLRTLLPGQVIQALRRHAQASRTTLFSVMLGAYKLLLWRLSLQARIPVATLVANRDDDRFDATVGLFFNALVLVSEISPEQSFREFVEATSRMTLDAMKHQQMPFQRLVDQHLPTRDPLRAPFTQALFTFLSASTQRLRLGEVELEQRGGIDAGSVYDLKMTAYQKGDGAEVVLEYNADLIEPSTAQCWHDVYLRMLDQLAENFDAPVRTLGFDGAAEAGPPGAVDVRDAWGTPVPPGFVGTWQADDDPMPRFARRLADGTAVPLPARRAWVGEGEGRIALQDVEQAMQRATGVRRALLTYDDEHGLTAHLVLQGRDFQLAALRRHLYACVPMHAVPERFRAVPWIPEHVSGVPDVDELWRIGREADARAARRVPRTYHEAEILRLWADTLREPELALDDNFFASGGNSLLAAMIVAETNRRFGCAVTLHQLFDAGTAAVFAAVVMQAQGSAKLVPWYEQARGSSAAWAHTEADGELSYPVSEAQARMWVLDRLIGASDRYILKTAHRIHGPLDRRALHAALRALTERHEPLRSVFQEKDGEVRQRFLPAQAIVLEELTSGQPGVDVPTAVRRVLDTPFDLRRGPLMRALLVSHAGEDVHEIHLAVHHIVADGWSMTVLVDDWLRLYSGQRTLAPLLADYRDYCCWRHSKRVLDAIADDLAYWRVQLRGAAADMPLPERSAVLPGPAVMGRHAFHLPAALCARLSRLCAADGTSLHTIVLAGFAVALWRYTGRADLSIGEPIANRDENGMEQLVGLFVNTVVLRLCIDPAAALGQLLRQTRETVLAALAHTSAPFDEVVQALKPLRHLDGSPLFETMFSFNEFPPTLSLPAELKLEDIPQPVTQPKFKLSCILTMADGTAYGELEFRDDVLDARAVRGLADDYVRLLEQWADRPDLPVHALAATPAWVERPPALFEPEAAGAADVFSILRRQAECTPERPALRDRDRTYSYAAVMDATQRVAGHLRARGIGLGARVGLCVPRSVDAVLCALGILRAGAAYSPMYQAGDEPNWREHARIAGLDAIVVADAAVAGQLSDRRPLLLEELFADAVARLDEVTSPPQSPAVVFRTSGSTGNPKYVVVPQQGIVDLVAWARHAYREDEYRNASFATALGFDVSLFEMFVPWSHGGCATLMDNVLDLEAGDVPFTCFSSTPTQVRGVLDEGKFPRGVGTLNMAGEALPQSLVARIFKETDVTRIVNLYGPTEATVYASFQDIHPGDAGPVKIGRPQPHVSLYVVDATLSQTPAAVSGEICIAGTGLAHGYAGNPALTAEYFVPDPFAAQPGARMYRTRDIGRVAHDGALQYLGRTDSVQKLRGVWVNFHELATDVRTCTGIRDAVVLPVPTKDGEDPLVVAFCITEEQVGFDESQLRGEFRERVAGTRPLAYGRTINRFLQVEHFPLNDNGKIDARALYANLPRAESQQHAAEQAPTGHIAKVLWEIWREVIRIEQVRPGDDFFAVGGHSLMALRMLSELEKATGVTMPLGAVFEFPVFADFVAEAERLVAARAGQDDKAASQAASRQAMAVIEPVDRNGPLPVSFAQQRMWFMAQMEGGSEAYHIVFGLRLDGRVDRPAMRRALDTIIARHESLRTTFSFEGGTLVQRIAPVQDSHFPLAEYDLRGLADWKGELNRLVAETSLAPFDFETGPLIRGALLQITEDRHVLRVNMHHMVSDGWSMGVMRREFGALYTAFRENKPNPLPPLPIQHVDYVAWQRRWMESESMRRQAEYWQSNLAGAPPFLELPADHPRPLHPQYKGSVIHFALDEELTDALKALGRRHGATPYMTLLAGWSILLSRLSGQRDIVIGSPVANRVRAETEHLIGFFANNLVLRLNLSDSPTVSEVIAQSRKQALAAQRNQDIPFEQVVELVQPVRSLSHSPLFQIMFAWQNMPRGKESELAGLKTGRLRSRAPRVTSRFDLTLSLYEMGKQIVGGAEYATSLFEHQTIERYLGYFRNILAAMVANEDMPVDRLALLGQGERRHLLHAWNDRHAAIPLQGMHQLIEEQARRTPHAPAVHCQGVELTYAQLDQRATALALRLGALGVGPGRRVALCAERSIECVVAMLAVLKAGGAYVPLDPGYPAERLHFMLADCAACVLLTGRGADGLFDGLEVGMPRLELDEKAAYWPEHAAPGAGLATDVLHPGQLAYVIYTSGSTGKPKGVMITHRAALNTIRDIHQRFGVDAHDRVLALSSFAFDLSVFDVFGLLMQGGTVVIPAAEPQPNPMSWQDAVAERGITLWNSVPALMQLFVDACEGQRRKFESVRLVMLSGDWVPTRLVAQIKALMPNAQVHSLGGATEASIWSISHPTTALDPARAMVPYGRALANQQMYVLDCEGEPCPVGVTGELYIGGEGVAQAYWARPALTASRFVPDGLSGRPGATLYRTGDLGRWLADGTIEFLGRNDFQVKLRGFRIELGEIEARLREHAALRDVVVAVRDKAGVGRRLVAYVTLEEGHVRPEPEQLSAHLGKTLPDYMLPAVYVLLTEMPLSPNNKIDRAKLPEPEQAGTFGANEDAPPQTETEMALAAIWSDLLQRPKIGRNDSFFLLGGHSLLVMRMVVRIRQELKLEMRMSDVFAHPVLCDLAEVLCASSLTTLPPISVESRDGALPLSFAQRRLWFLSQTSQISRAYHISLGLTLVGDLDAVALRRALDRIVARHESLRTTFLFEDGEPMQRIVPVEQAAFALFEHDLRDREDAQAELVRLVRRSAYGSFDLEAGPLARGCLVRLEDRKHVLRLTLHHIVTDAWSMGILAHELSELYRAFHQGRPDPLRLPAIQYADYAAWQRRWIEGDVLRQQAAYWQARLAGSPTLLQLPTDRPRPSVQRYEGGQVDVELDPALTDALRELASRHTITLHMLLLAAWALLLSRLSGQEDILVGTPVANRRQAETDRVIGFFINTLAMRIDLSGAPSVGELLRRVRDASVDALQNQDIPFEKVVELVQPERSLAHSPLFQVLFQWQTRGEASFALDGVTIARSRGTRAQRTVKFDLSLSLYEREERIVGGIEYASSLFDAETIERYAGYLSELLRGMVRDGAPTVDRLPLLGAQEQRRLLIEWNHARIEPPETLCIHQLFEAQAQKSPNAPALSCAGHSVTYADLDQQANRLAQVLRTHGVGPDQRVAICLERGLPMVVSLLAVLKAGGAYVSLDPGYPLDRLHYILQDAAPSVLLAAAPQRDWLAAQIDRLGLVALDPAALPAGGHAMACMEQSGVGPQNLAYVVYTSGSTGRPKGVAIEHRHTVNFLRWAAGAFSREAVARTLFSTSLNFDLSVYECLLPLTVGAQVRMVSNVLELGTAGDDVTLVNTVPSAMQALLEAGAVGAGVNTINLAGEALSAQLVKRIFAATQAKEVCNLYGPSETTTYSTWMRITRDAPLAPTIGRPIANTQIYILDAHAAPVPQGVVGEIHIGGSGVTRGYLGKPGLTAERFGPDPFTASPGERMYRTGDLGRWLADGNIEFLGRNDHQVKVRGFRIELGEIEACLAEAAGVRSVAVVARQGGREAERLIAYVTPQTDRAGVEVERLRNHVAAHLPEYMCPSAYVVLDALPLTPNGKLDRAALPAPSAPGGEAYEPPAGDTEQALAALWAELLGLPRVGRDDNFFVLGGHSLLAMRLVALLRQRGWSVEALDLFMRPTVRALAEHLIAPAAIADGGLLRVRAQGDEPPLFCVHDGTDSLQYLYALAPQLPGSMPILGLPAPTGEEEGLETIVAMAQRMVGLMVQEWPSGPYRVAGWSIGGVIAYEIAHQLRRDGKQVDFLGLFDAAYLRGTNGFERLSDADTNLIEDKKLYLLQLIRSRLASHSDYERLNQHLSSIREQMASMSFEAMLAKCQEAGIMPLDFAMQSAEQLSRTLDRQRIYLRAQLGYEAPRIGMRMHLFQAQINMAKTPLLGWGRVLPEPSIHVIGVPGDHFSMMSREHAEFLGRELATAILSVGKSTSSTGVEEGSPVRGDAPALPTLSTTVP